MTSRGAVFFLLSPRQAGLYKQEPMHFVSRKTAIKVIYWNAVVAVMVVCLSGVSLIRRIHRYDTLIVQASRACNVDPRLVSSVIWRESRFKPYVVGEKGEIGLMQITMPAAMEWAKAENIPPPTRETLFNPDINIQAGTWYLARAIRYWSKRSDPLPFALAEYNAGRVNAQRWAAMSGPNSRKFWETITYPTTKKYIHDILKRYRGKV